MSIERTRNSERQLHIERQIWTLSMVFIFSKLWENFHKLIVFFQRILSIRTFFFRDRQNISYPAPSFFRCSKNMCTKKTNDTETKCTKNRPQGFTKTWDKFPTYQFMEQPKNETIWHTNQEEYDNKSEILFRLRSLQNKYKSEALSMCLGECLHN